MANTWITSTLPKIISTLTTQQSTFKSGFCALTTNADRVQFCQAEKVIQTWTGQFVSKFGSIKNALKCSKTAEKYREKGNDYFRANNYQRAIELYSAAICFAPQSADHSEVAFAFGNRSAAYFQVGQYEHALMDIDAALTFGYDRFKPVTKLQLRKVDCLIRLGRASEAKELLLLIQKPIQNQEENNSDTANRCIELFDRINLNDDKIWPSKTKISLIEKLTQKGLFISNEKMPSLSAKVDMCYDEEKGRHFVAKEDIKFGDILGILRPYVSMFGVKDDTVKCHHCCRDFYHGDSKVGVSAKPVSLRPIPCINCSSVMFCSEECRTESSASYHRYECGQHDLLVQFGESYRIALRLLYRAGMDQIRSVVFDDKKDSSDYFAEQAEEDHYSRVYHLVHHSDGLLNDLAISFKEMLELSLVACILLQLAKLGHFHTSEEEVLIGGLLLRHLHQLRYNIVEYCPLDKVSTPPLSFDLYPLYASGLNHSCRPNARLELLTNECLLQAAQPICAGTEITISYLNDKITEYKGEPSFAASNQKNKRRDLLIRFGFHCNCVLCSYHIRNNPYSLEVCEYVPLSCGDCGHLIEHSSEQLFHCTKCLLKMSHAEVTQRYREHYQMRISLNQLMNQINFKLVAEQHSLFSRIESTVRLLEASFHPDSLQAIGYVHSMIALHYLGNSHFDKWWGGNERFLSVIERLFGEESTTFIQEFDRMYETILQPIVQLDPMVMQDFQQQDRKLYERHLARVEQWKQLKHKYYAAY